MTYKGRLKFAGVLSLVIHVIRREYTLLLFDKKNVIGREFTVALCDKKDVNSRW